MLIIGIGYEALMQPFLRRAVEDPGGFKRGLLETMPRMLFALLPVFAKDILHSGPNGLGLLQAFLELADPLAERPSDGREVAAIEEKQRKDDEGNERKTN